MGAFRFHSPRAVSVVLLLVATLSVGRALAEAEDPAAELYREGAALAAEGKWQDAAKKFESAVAIRATPVGLFNLAQAERNLGQLAAAKRHFVSARSLATRDGAEDVVRLADDALAAINPRVPKVSLRLPADAAGVSAEVDGRPHEIVGGVIEVDPGQHKLVVAAAGERPFSRELEIREGQKLSVVVEFPEPPARRPARAALSPKPKPELEPTHASSGVPTGALLLGGAGALALAAGTYFHVRRSDKLEEAAENCVRSGDGWRCPSSLENDSSHQALRDDASRAETARNVLLGVGASAIIAGGLWWALGTEGDTRETRTPGAARSGKSSKGIALGVTATPSAASARMRVRF